MSKISHDSETPAHGQQVISVCSFIHRKVDGVDQVFLAKRANTKKFLPGIYELPGGHVDFGEDIAAALTREIVEEFNMSIKVGDPFWAFTYQNLIKGSHSIEVIYFATFVSALSDISINEEDHSEYGWFDEEQVKTIVAKNRAEGKRFNSVQNNSGEDLETKAILKGFSLLKNRSLNFG